MTPAQKERAVAWLAGLRSEDLTNGNIKETYACIGRGATLSFKVDGSVRQDLTIPCHSHLNYAVEFLVNPFWKENKNHTWFVPWFLDHWKDYIVFGNSDGFVISGETPKYILNKINILSRMLIEGSYNLTSAKTLSDLSGLPLSFCVFLCLQATVDFKEKEITKVRRTHHFFSPELGLKETLKFSRLEFSEVGLPFNREPSYHGNDRIFFSSSKHWLEELYELGIKEKEKKTISEVVNPFARKKIHYSTVVLPSFDEFLEKGIPFLKGYIANAK